MKDVVLLAVSVYLLKQDVVRLTSNAGTHMSERDEGWDTGSILFQRRA